MANTKKLYEDTQEFASRGWAKVDDLENQILALKNDLNNSLSIQQQANQFKSLYEEEKIKRENFAKEVVKLRKILSENDKKGIEQELESVKQQLKEARNFSDKILAEKNRLENELKETTQKLNSGPTHAELEEERAKREFVAREALKLRQKLAEVQNNRQDHVIGSLQQQIKQHTDEILAEKQEKEKIQNENKGLHAQIQKLHSELGSTTEMTKNIEVLRKELEEEKEKRLRAAKEGIRLRQQINDLQANVTTSPSPSPSTSGPASDLQTSLAKEKERAEKLAKENIILHQKISQIETSGSLVHSPSVGDLPKKIDELNSKLEGISQIQKVLEMVTKLDAPVKEICTQVNHILVESRDNTKKSDLTSLEKAILTQRSDNTSESLKELVDKISGIEVQLKAKTGDDQHILKEITAIKEHLNNNASLPKADTGNNDSQPPVSSVLESPASPSSNTETQDNKNNEEEDTETTNDNNTNNNQNNRNKRNKRKK